MILKWNIKLHSGKKDFDKFIAYQTCTPSTPKNSMFKTRLKVNPNYVLMGKNKPSLFPANIDFE